MPLSVIIPTIGRPTLARTIESFYSQMKPRDEIIVVGDGFQPEARRICALYKGIRYLEYGPVACWGHPQRNFAMPLAQGTHLSFMDDDDIYTPGIREEINERLMPKPVIFRMQGKDLLWQRPIIEMGNVGTPMIVVPNDPQKLGMWGRRYEGDYDFYCSCQWRDVEWRTDIIALLRP